MPGSSDFSQVSHDNVSTGYLCRMMTFSSRAALNALVAHRSITAPRCFSESDGNSLPRPKCHHWPFQHFMVLFQMTMATLRSHLRTQDSVPPFSVMGADILWKNSQEGTFLLNYVEAETEILCKKNKAVLRICFFRNQQAPRNWLA